MFVDLQMVFISLCEHDSSDSNCTWPDSIDPSGDVKTTVIKYWYWCIKFNQFVCLVNNGDTSSPNYNEYDIIDDAINDDDNLEEEICERPTPSPTLNLTPIPTLKRTPHPTFESCDDINCSLCYK